MTKAQAPKVQVAAQASMINTVRCVVCSKIIGYMPQGVEVKRSDVHVVPSLYCSMDCARKEWAEKEQLTVYVYRGRAAKPEERT